MIRSATPDDLPLVRELFVEFGREIANAPHRDDDSGDRPRSQRDANEMARRKRETFWHDVAERSCRTAEPGEDGDLGGAGR